MPATRPTLAKRMDERYPHIGFVQVIWGIRGDRLAPSCILQLPTRPPRLQSILSNRLYPCIKPLNPELVFLLPFLFHYYRTRLTFLGTCVGSLKTRSILVFLAFIVFSSLHRPNQRAFLSFIVYSS